MNVACAGSCQTSYPTTTGKEEQVRLIKWEDLVLCIVYILVILVIYWGYCEDMFAQVMLSLSKSRGFSAGIIQLVFMYSKK